jgi:hypothetical protein
VKIKCIVCLKDTEFEEGATFESREATYIEGCGQLCEECMEKVAANKDVIDVELIRIRDEKALRWHLTPLDPYKAYPKMTCTICFQLRDALGDLLGRVVYHCEPCARFFQNEDVL